MAAILPWLQEHWFDLVQTLGIVASVSFTAASLRREWRGRRMTDHLTLVSHHRELWIDVNRRPELSRILQPEVDLLERPISLVEEDYLNLVIVHYTTGWLMARDGGLVGMEVLATDARAFFSLPIPNAVWEQTSRLLDPDFVAFIRRALADSGSTTRLSSVNRWTRRIRRVMRLRFGQAKEAFRVGISLLARSTGTIWNWMKESISRWIGGQFS